MPQFQISVKTGTILFAMSKFQLGQQRPKKTP